jgi:hypothetical protein
MGSFVDELLCIDGIIVFEPQLSYLNEQRCLLILTHNAVGIV